MGCVYLITSPSGKQYVGMTTRTLAERWREHIYDALHGKGACFMLARALKKYGPESFTTSILHESDDVAELDRLERLEIKARGTLTPSGYNRSTGGIGVRLDGELEAARIEAVRAAMKRPEVISRREEIQSSHEFRAKLRSVMIKACARPGAKEKKSQATRTVLEDTEKYAARCRQLDAARMPPEEYARQSRERWADPEFRARTGAAIKAARTPESYRRSGEKMKQKFADPDFRQKMLAAQKAGIQRAAGDGTYKRAAKQSMSKAEVREKIRTSVIAHWTQERRQQQRDFVLKNEKLIRSRKAAQARDHFDPAWVAKQGGRPVCIDNRYFPSAGLADKLLGLKAQVARGRCDSTSEKWANWHYFTARSGDTECDAVEECWAVMQWAEANGDEVDAPEWARPKLDPELVALEQEIRDMLAKRRRRQAASSERASAAA